MHRRTFVGVGAASLGLLPLLPTFTFADPQPVAKESKPAWLLELIKLNDQHLSQSRTYRITEPGNPAFGGFIDGDDIPNPHSTTGFVRQAACSIACPESSFYRSKELLAEVGPAVQALLKMQHDDGTIDLLSTNFHSTPDTGFLVKRLVPAYTLLERSGTPGREPVLAALKTFLLRGGEALSAGGIHTPNHRWVVCAALTKLQERWPNPRYLNRIEEWLSEHIDMDADGQYNERSTLIYSPLTNRLLITIAKGLNKPELLGYVRRNLAMTLYYLHPNGEVVTEASGRQDKALVGTPEGYYYACRYMALLDKDGQMAAMCRLIEQNGLPKLVGFLDYFLEDPAFWNELPAASPLPTNYVKEFSRSGLVRIRRGNWDSTILSANPVWLTFSRGKAMLQGMRVAASFFGKGQFQTEKITREGNSWVLTQSLDGPYFQPFSKENIAEDGDWEKMPRDKRRQSEVQRLDSKVTLTETADGMEVQIALTGTDGVPVALELIFRPGGSFTGVLPHPTRDKAFLLKESAGTYAFQGDTITFGPGLAQHKNVQLRGALPAMDAPTVYLTGFTPFRHTIRLS
ncbi:hypothetical protein GCM10023189_22720 [Nibrella saemangeumensis]|uniref:Alginate lyase n=1 Tax=Nibrella saemangeumensis TaxID=1084526 RepID=A0ABP8MS20_9BACT